MPEYQFIANVFTYSELTQDVSEAFQTEVALELGAGSGDSFSYQILFTPGITLPIVQTTLDFSALRIPSRGRVYDETPDFEVFGDVIYPDDTRVTVLGFSYEEGDFITEITLCIDGDLRPIDVDADLAARGRGGASQSPFAPGDQIDLAAVSTGHGDAPQDPADPDTPTDGDDLLTGTQGGDRIDAGAGNDTVRALDGPDTVIGGAGDDLVEGGASAQDRADVIFGGAGNDTLDGGYGNDQLRGDAGDDVLTGGFGADTVIGGAGNDRLSAGALGDVLFGGDGNDFLNGGFGYDRLNGGTGADEFFHLGIADHGSDFIQDYAGAEGDTLVFGRAGATRGQFQINYANTQGAGDAAVEEAFVIYRPTGQVIWALIDGAAQDEINLTLGGQNFDLTM